MLNTDFVSMVAYDVYLFAHDSTNAHKRETGALQSKIGAIALQREYASTPMDKHAGI